MSLGKILQGTLIIGALINGGCKQSGDVGGPIVGNTTPSTGIVEKGNYKGLNYTINYNRHRTEIRLSGYSILDEKVFSIVAVDDDNNGRFDSVDAEGLEVYDQELKRLIREKRVFLR